MANVMVIKNGTVKLTPQGGTAATVECQLTEATVVATPNLKTATTMCDLVSVPGTTGFALQLAGLQDWGTDAVSELLYDGDGTLADFELIPSGSATPKMTGTVWLVPGNFGGIAGEIAVFTAVLPCVGKPTLVPAAAP